jgi:hypothetical protein
LRTFPPPVSLQLYKENIQLFKTRNFFSFFGGHFRLPGSRSTDLIASGFDWPNPKHFETVYLKITKVKKTLLARG